MVSTKSGLLFEKRLVEQYVATTGKCPVTHEPLSAAELLPVRVNTGGNVAHGVAPPRAVGEGVPALLRALQREWDATMLEAFQLKQHLDLARQELAHSLYQYDAATRVIARLALERDQAREALKNAQLAPAAAASAAAASGPAAMATDSPAALPADLLASLQAHTEKLMAARSKRTVSRSLATQENIARYECAHSQQLHGLPPGVTCLAVHPADSQIVVTGGADGTALVFNHAAQKIAAELVGHSARINAVAVGAAAIVTGSADRTVRVWRQATPATAAAKGKGSKAAAAAAPAFAETLRYTGHTDEVVAVSVQPKQTLAASASKDATWALHAIDADRDGGAVPLFAYKSTSPFLSASFHPDGLLLGAGDAHGTFALFDLSTCKSAVSIDAHQGGVAAVAFSENGYYVATGGASDNTVKLWDLRKSKCLHTVRLGPDYVVRSLAFDESGVYLAVTGNDARIFAGKTLAPVVTFSDHAAPVTGACFGPDAAWIATASIDRTVRLWKPHSA